MPTIEENPQTGGPFLETDFFENYYNQALLNSWEMSKKLSNQLADEFYLINKLKSDEYQGEC